MENAYKILDIIKELKGNHIGCYYDKICDVAERKYGFENSTADNYLDYCINNGFIARASSRVKISYRLVAVPDINIDDEDSLTSTIVENAQLVIPGSAASISSLNEGGRRQSNNFLEWASLINCDNDGKNYNELSLNLDRSVDVDLDLEGNIHTKNLSFYRQKITLLENQNSFY